MAANGQYKITISAVDEATEKLRKINKEMAQALAPQRALQKETDKFYKLQEESQRKWQTRVADAARSMDYPKLAEHFDRMASNSRRAASGVGDLMGAFRGLAGVAGIALSFAEAMGKAADAVGRMGADAVRLKTLQALTGTSPEQARAIEGAGQLNGVRPEAMDGTLVGFGNALQQSVMDPASQQAQLLRANGIDAKSAAQWQAEAPDKQMGHLADLFKRLKDSDASGASSAQAAGILGIDPSAIAMLQRGGKPLQDDIATAQKNNPWTPEMQKAGEEYTRAMGDLQQKMNHLGEEIAVHLIPVVGRAATAFGDAIVNLSTGLGKFSGWLDDFLHGDHTHANANNRGGHGAGGAPPSDGSGVSAGNAGPRAGKPAASDPFTEAWDWFTAGRHGRGQPAGSAPPITEKSMSPRAKGLLDTIAGPESGGDYRRMYGKDANGANRYMTDAQMASNGDLPGAPIMSGPNKGKMSTAAGKYQFINGTWQEASKALGLKDRSPQSQDRAAWWVAQRDYKANTGRDLSVDVESKDPQVISGIAAALNKTWTSLRGGIEQGKDSNSFAATLAAKSRAYEAQQASEHAREVAVAPPPAVAAGPRATVAANQNTPPLGLLNVNINGSVPNTVISADAKGSVFGGPPKVQQTLAAG